MPKVLNGTTGTVVEEYMIGNTKIKICNDAYINRSPEEIEQSLKRINDICLNFVMSDRYKGQQSCQPDEDETIPCAGERRARGSPSGDVKHGLLHVLSIQEKDVKWNAE